MSEVTEKFNEENVVLTLVLVFALLLSVPLSAIFCGYTLAILWKWFVMSTFVSAPALNIPTAIGLSMMVRFVTHEVVDCQPKDESTVAKLSRALLYPFVSCGVVLGFGWILLKFM